jgi:hypothetical protein
MRELRRNKIFATANHARVREFVATISGHR